MCEVFVESEDKELEFTEILNVNAGDVIDNNSSNESGLHLHSDRDVNLSIHLSVNLSINLDTTSTVSSNSSNVLENSPGQINSENPNVVLNELRANNSERLIRDKLT